MALAALDKIWGRAVFGARVGGRGFSRSPGQSLGGRRLRPYAPPEEPALVLVGEEACLLPQTKGWWSLPLGQLGMGAALVLLQPVSGVEQGGTGGRDITINK
jgi:hypothetical protein